MVEWMESKDLKMKKKMGGEIIKTSADTISNYYKLEILCINIDNGTNSTIPQINV